MAWSDAYVSIGGLLSGSICPVQKYPFENRVLSYNDTAAAHSHSVGSEPGPLRISIPYTGYPDVSIDKTLLAVFPQYDSTTGTIVRWLRVYYQYQNRVSFGRPEVAIHIWLAGYEISTGEYAIADEQESIVTESGYVDYMFELYLYICGGTVPGEDYKFYGVGISAYSTTLDKYSWAYVLTTDQRLQTGDIPEKHDISPEFGPGSEPEGYETPGGYDDHSDIISLPPKPQSILSLGFLNVYKCGANALHDFGAAMFPEINFPQSLSDVGEVLAAFSDSIWNSKLIDYIVSVHCVPGDVAATGNLEDIKVGARTMTGILARKIDNEYVDHDFGSINVAPYFKNYADYMTEIQLYLPGYGFISLRPEEIIGGEISVTYRFNVLDGSFMAYVFSTSNRSKLKTSMIGQYGGSCIVHLPVSNLSYSSMFSSMVGGAASAAMGIASGGAGAVAGALAATSMATQAAQGGDVKKSNSYNASSSFMARLQPYVIVTRPQPSFSQRYNIENGFPSNVAMTIGSCTGFTTAENAILDGIPCTDAEREKIRNLLKSGIVIRA